MFTLEWIEGDGKLTNSDRKALAAIQSELEAAGEAANEALVGVVNNEEAPAAARLWGEPKSSIRLALSEGQ